MIAAELTAPIAGPDALPRGWLHHSALILQLLEAHRPKVCVELGSWLGKSAAFTARAVRRWGGTVTCVDTWMGDGLRSGDPSAQPWMLVTCARNLRDAGVAPAIRLIPCTTREAAAAWSGPAIDYLYVDADHGYDAVAADLTDWLPHMAPGGLLLGDDYGHPHFPGVREAWDAFERNHEIALTRSAPDVEGIQIVYGTVNP